MNAKIARDDDYNDHYADDVKDHVLTLAPEDVPTTANSVAPLLFWVLFVIIYIREGVVRPSCPSGGQNRLAQELLRVRSGRASAGGVPDTAGAAPSCQVA